MMLCVTTAFATQMEQLEFNAEAQEIPKPYENIWNKIFK